MVIATHKLFRKKFYEPQTVDAEYVKAGSHKHLEVSSSTPVRLKAKTDFVIAGVSKGSFVILEMKRGTRQLDSRQISAYLRTPITAGGFYTLAPTRELKQSRMLLHEGIETLPEVVKVARPIEIYYLNQELVEGLLGNNGKYVLRQVLKVIKDTTLEWPLNRIEISYVRDSEVKDWEYVLLFLVFTCDFDIADRYLHELYNEIDLLTSRLSTEEQEILQRMIFFDIKTRASIPGA